MSPIKLGVSRLGTGHYLRWARKGTLAVLDQGIFSGSNFVVSVLLGRWMTERDYGAYSIAFSIFLLISGFYNVLLLEPMSIFGPVRHRDHFLAYFKQLTWLHGVGTMGAALVIVASASIARVFAPESALVNAFLGLGLAHGLTLFFWLSRRACYVGHELGKALFGTIIYSGGVIGGTAYLNAADLLTPLCVFVFIGFAGVIAGAAQSGILFRGKQAHPSYGSLPIRGVARENWDYGRWMIIASTAHWLSTWAYFVLAGSMLSLGDVAGLRAIQNFVMPLTQIFTAFMLLFAPWAAQRFAHNGIEVLWEAMWAYSVVMGAICGVYSLVVWLFQDTLFAVLYDGNFAQYQWMLPILLLQPLIIALTGSWIFGLRIVDRTRDVMTLNMIGGVTTLTAGSILIGVWGLRGAVIGMVLSSLVQIPTLIVMWWNLRRRFA